MISGLLFQLTPYVVIDVDDTLITWFEDEPILRLEVDDLAKTLRSLGFKIVVWSGGGEGYAKEMVHIARSQGFLEPDNITTKDVPFWGNPPALIIDDRPGADVGLKNVLIIPPLLLQNKMEKETYRQAVRCDVTSCFNYSVIVEVGEAGDLWLCRAHGH